MIMTLCLDLLPLHAFRVGIGHQGINGVLSYGHLHLISGRLIFMGAHKYKHCRISKLSIVHSLMFRQDGHCTYNITL
jgi:hypothetical protein